MTVMVDPPEGWRYGFPKALPEPEEADFSFIDWMRDQGYPQRLIDQGMLDHCRYFTTTAAKGAEQ